MLSGLLGWLLNWLVFGLLCGLDDVVRSYLLRFWLAQSGIFPWRAVPFLEDATARILLRRVESGYSFIHLSGYSFIHRLLLDYFADLEKNDA